MPSTSSSIIVPPTSTVEGWGGIVFFQVFRWRNTQWNDGTCFRWVYLDAIPVYLNSDKKTPVYLKNTTQPKKIIGTETVHSSNTNTTVTSTYYYYYSHTKSVNYLRRTNAWFSGSLYRSQFTAGSMTAQTKSFRYSILAEVVATCWCLTIVNSQLPPTPLWHAFDEELLKASQEKEECKSLWNSTLALPSYTGNELRLWSGKSLQSSSKSDWKILHCAAANDDHVPRMNCYISWGELGWADTTRLQRGYGGELQDL